MREKPGKTTMLSDIGPVITGWCLYHESQAHIKTGTSIMDIIINSKIPGTPAGISKKPEYSHCQVGIVQLWAGILALIIVMVTAYFCQEIFLLLLIPIGLWHLGSYSFRH